MTSWSAYHNTKQVSGPQAFNDLEISLVSYVTLDNYKDIRIVCSRDSSVYMYEFTKHADKIFSGTAIISMDKIHKKLLKESESWAVYYGTTQVFTAENQSEMLKYLEQEVTTKTYMITSVRKIFSLTNVTLDYTFNTNASLLIETKQLHEPIATPNINKKLFGTTSTCEEKSDSKHILNTAKIVSNSIGSDIKPVECSQVLINDTNQQKEYLKEYLIITDDDIIPVTFKQIPEKLFEMEDISSVKIYDQNESITYKYNLQKKQFISNDNTYTLGLSENDLKYQYKLLFYYPSTIDPFDLHKVETKPFYLNRVTPDQYATQMNDYCSQSDTVKEVELLIHNNNIKELFNVAIVKNNKRIGSFNHNGFNFKCKKTHDKTSLLSVYKDICAKCQLYRDGHYLD